MGEISGDSVEFNEAFAQINRINQLKQDLNICFTNLLATNEQTGQRNYIIGLNTLHNLFFEISGELTDKEKEQVERLQSALEYIKDNYKFFQHKQSNSLSNVKSIEVNVVNFKVFERALWDYRLLINQLMKKHGYSNPNKENPKFAMQG